MRLHGPYEMGIGFGSGNTPPPIAATIHMQSGSRYEMTHPDGWHFVSPRGWVHSVMVSGPTWNRASPKPDKTLGNLSDRQKMRILDEFHALYPDRLSVLLRRIFDGAHGWRHGNFILLEPSRQHDIWLDIRIWIAGKDIPSPEHLRETINYLNQGEQTKLSRDIETALNMPLTELTPHWQDMQCANAPENEATLGHYVFHDRFWDGLGWINSFRARRYREDILKASLRQMRKTFKIESTCIKNMQRHSPESWITQALGLPKKTQVTMGRFRNFVLDELFYQWLEYFRCLTWKQQEMARDQLGQLIGDITN